MFNLLKLRPRLRHGVNRKPQFSSLAKPTTHCFPFPFVDVHSLTLRKAGILRIFQCCTKVGNTQVVLEITHLNQNVMPLDSKTFSSPLLKCRERMDPPWGRLLKCSISAVWLVWFWVLYFDSGSCFLLMASPLPHRPRARISSSHRHLHNVFLVRYGQLRDCACLRLPQRVQLGSYPSMANQPSSLANSRAPSLRGCRRGREKMPSTNQHFYTRRQGTGVGVLSHFPLNEKSHQVQCPNASLQNGWQSFAESEWASGNHCPITGTTASHEA